LYDGRERTSSRKLAYCPTGTRACPFFALEQGASGSYVGVNLQGFKTVAGIRTSVVGVNKFTRDRFALASSLLLKTSPFSFDVLAKSAELRVFSSKFAGFLCARFAVRTTATARTRNGTCTEPCPSSATVDAPDGLHLLTLGQ
jgi:hypothetical protein